MTVTEVLVLALVILVIFAVVDRIRR